MDIIRVETDKDYVGFFNVGMFVSLEKCEGKIFLTLLEEAKEVVYTLEGSVAKLSYLSKGDLNV